MAGNREEKYVPNDLLCSFEELYGKIKNKRLMEDTLASGKQFQPQGTQGSSIKELNYWRNRFVHFFPWALSLDAEILHPIFLDCVNTIRFLAFESGHIYFESEKQEAQVGTLLNEISEKLTCLCV